MTVCHPYLSILTQMVKMCYLIYFWHYSEMEKAVCVRGSISDFEEVSLQHVSDRHFGQIAKQLEGPPNTFWDRKRRRWNINWSYILRHILVYIINL